MENCICVDDHFSYSGVCEIKYHRKETRQHLSAPPPNKSKLERKYYKPFCAWMVLYFTRLSRGRNTLSTLTNLGGGAGRCCWTSLRWYFISQTPDPDKSQNRGKKQMRPSLDHFGHHFFLSWGVCEAIPGSPRALLVQLGVVNTNAILHSWSLVDLQTLQHRCYNICLRSVFLFACRDHWHFWYRPCISP